MITLIKNATIFPVTYPSFVGDILIKDSTISELGIHLSVEDNAENIKIIDATGHFVFPGFIDAHTHLGMYNEGVGWEGKDTNELTQPVAPFLRAIDSVNPQDIAFKEALSHGITAVQVLPGSFNPIGGLTSVIKTHGSNISDMIVRANNSLKIALGENPKSKHKLTRMGIMGLIRKAFIDAMTKEETFENVSLKRVLRKEIPIRVHAHQANDILSIIRLAEEFDLDLRIEHCTEGHLIVDELVKNNPFVTVGPTMSARSKYETRYKTFETYKVLSDAGINISITTDHPYMEVRYLPLAAAIAVKEGLSEQTALEAITINPAKNIGVEDVMGSLEIGKHADIVVWDKHPFDIMAKPLKTLINGNLVFSRN